MLRQTRAGTLRGPHYPALYKLGQVKKRNAGLTDNSDRMEHNRWLTRKARHGIYVFDNVRIAREMVKSLGTGDKEYVVVRCAVDPADFLHGSTPRTETYSVGRPGTRNYRYAQVSGYAATYEKILPLSIVS